jgi:hypothetical protein
LESKHTFTLGQLFKISFDLNNMLLPNYLLGEKIFVIKPNLIMALVAIDPHMVMT